jgi:hypothetical protein
MVHFKWEPNFEFRSGHGFLGFRGMFIHLGEWDLVVDPKNEEHPENNHFSFSVNSLEPGFGWVIIFGSFRITITRVEKPKLIHENKEIPPETGAKV